MITICRRLVHMASAGSPLMSRFQSSSLVNTLHASILPGVPDEGAPLPAVDELIDAGATSDEVRLYLDREARSVAADKGVNHWRYALLDGLANHEAFYRAQAS